MALKPGVVKDILCVIAYGTAAARASAAKLLFYYWPSFNPNLFDRRAVLVKFASKYYIHTYMHTYIHARARAHTHTHTHIYTGYFILIAPGKYLEKYGNYEKMFQTKVVWLEGGHKMVSLV